MGVSTDAMLWFGYCSDGDGMPEGVIEHVLKNNPGFDEDGVVDQIEERLLKELGIDLIRHCTPDDPMYGLAIATSQRTAWRGSPVDVKTIEEPPVEWLERLEKAAKLIGWPTAVEPMWWMASYWG